MQLSLRLSAIADLVTEGNRLVDVGCDHGYLPVYLIQQKKIPSAIAMDVRKGPLSRAQEHIQQYGLEEYIQTRLSDGLEGLKAGEGDTLVIAGMGGPLMERILTDGRSVRDSFSELILQPQSDIPHFRRFIQSEGWEITEEKMVEEDGKFYPMMRVVYGACLKNKGDTHGFQLDALSMDLSALSTGSVLYKSRKNPKWNPGIFQSAFLCMGRATLCFSYAVFRGSEFYWRNSD